MTIEQAIREVAVDLRKTAEELGAKDIDGGYAKEAQIVNVPLDPKYVMSFLTFFGGRD